MNYIRGDLLTSDRDIAHGCNALGIMGAGVAEQIANKYPDACRPYFENKSERVGGKVIAGHDTASDKIIYHCITQDTVSRYQRTFNYEYFAQCLVQLGHIAPRAIAMPKIGAGLAGGDWEIIEKMIERILVKDSGVKVDIWYL